MQRSKLTQRQAVLSTLVLLVSLLAAVPLEGREAARLNLAIVVTDSQTGQPVSQAQITLQFHEPGKLRHKLISYTAKTNAQGHCKFPEIPEGTLHLIVTHTGHQSFGKDFDVDASHAEIEIKLKPPHPQI